MGYLDTTGLTYLWSQLKTKFVLVDDYVEFTSDEKTKLAGIATGAEVNTIDSISVNGTEQTITDKAVDITVPTALSELTNDGNYVVDASYVHTDNNYTTAEQTKLAGIEDSAEVNIIESISLNGTAVTVTDKAVDILAIPTSQKGASNGVAPLNSSGTIDATYLPSYVDDVVEVYIVGSTAYASDWFSDTESGTAITPETGKIYVVLSTGDYYNMEYRWGGSAYVKINDSGVTAITTTEIDTILAS